MATGSAVATHVGLIAAGLPAGAEVPVPEGDFVSAMNPFVVRGDLAVRFAPLERPAESIGPATALVARSAVPSPDGRTDASPTSPGLVDRRPALLAAGGATAALAGAPRASFHLYDTGADVDRLPAALGT